MGDRAPTGRGQGHIRCDCRLFASAEKVAGGGGILQRLLESAGSQPAVYQLDSQGPTKAIELLAKYAIGETLKEL